MKKIIFAFYLLICVFCLHAQSTDNSIPKVVEKEPFIVKMFSTYTQNLNYFTVTALMTVESSCFIPFPSEVVVPPAAYQACNPENSNLYTTESKWINITLVVLFATLGAVLGAVINYYFALFLGRPFIYWFVETKVGRLCSLDTKKIQKAENYFVKNGTISTLIGRLIPVIRQVISVPAGLAKMNIKPFILYTTIGAGIWNVALAFVGYFAHGQQDIILKYSHEISYIILGIIVLFGIYLIYKAFGKKKQ